MLCCRSVHELHFWLASPAQQIFLSFPIYDYCHSSVLSRYFMCFEGNHLFNERRRLTATRHFLYTWCDSVDCCSLNHFSNYYQAKSIHHILWTIVNKINQPTRVSSSCKEIQEQLPTSACESIPMETQIYFVTQFYILAPKRVAIPEDILPIRSCNYIWFYLS